MSTVRSWLRNGWTWVALAPPLGFGAGVAIYSATTIIRPFLGCTVPQPRDKEAAFHAALGDMGNIATVANWLAIAGLVTLIFGLLAARNRVPVLAFVLPYLAILFIV